MIFIMLGTNPYPFDRLMNAAGEYAETAGERIIAQIGNTTPRSNIECYRYLSHSEIMKYIAEAEVVVCQGGYGSICDCLSAGAKTVVVPRRREFGECVDNQVELVDAFAKEGLIVPVMNINELRDAIDKAKNIKMRKKQVSRLPVHIASTIRGMLSGERDEA